MTIITNISNIKDFILDAEVHLISINDVDMSLFNNLTNYDHINKIIKSYISQIPIYKNWNWCKSSYCHLKYITNGSFTFTNVVNVAFNITLEFENNGLLKAVNYSQQYHEPKEYQITSLDVLIIDYVY